MSRGGSKDPFYRRLDEATCIDPGVKKILTTRLGLLPCGCMGECRGHSDVKPKMGTHAASRLPKAEAVASCWCDEHGTDLCPLHRTKCIECGQELPASLLGSDVARPVAEPAPQAFEEWWSALCSRKGNYPLGWKELAELAWNAAKASSPALSVREEIARDDAIIQDVVNRGAFFLDWRLASLAAKKGHRGLMTTTAGDFVVLTDRQELELRQATYAVASSSPTVAGGESETATKLLRDVMEAHPGYNCQGDCGECVECRARKAAWDYLYNVQPLIKDVRGKE